MVGQWGWEEVDEVDEIAGTKKQKGRFCRRR